MFRFVLKLFAVFGFRKDDEIRQRNEDLYRDAVSARRVTSASQLIATGAYESAFDLAIVTPAVGAGLAREMAKAHEAEEREAQRAAMVTLPADDDKSRAIWDRENCLERFETL